ncbi:RHS repeat-associated core domain-containing protein [Pseudomonas phoenicis]
MKSLILQAYSPYGFQEAGARRASVMNFNGQRLDRCAGVYLLGNGYRGFSPALMRFVAPDSWSPFGAGGLNAYAYCAGDPLTSSDPSGHRALPQRGAAPNTMGLLLEELRLINAEEPRTPFQARVQAETLLQNRAFSRELDQLQERIQAIDQARSVDLARDWTIAIAESRALNLTVGQTQATVRVRADLSPILRTPVTDDAVPGQFDPSTPANGALTGAIPIPVNAARLAWRGELGAMSQSIRMHR